MTTLTTSDTRRLRAEPSAQDQAGRRQYESGKRDRWRRKVREFAWIAGGLAALWALTRSHRAHPLLRVIAFYGLLLALWGAIVLSPVLAGVSVFRQHRRRRDWQRTGLLSGSWIAGFGGVALAYLTVDPWPLLVPALLVLSWHVVSRAQGRRRSLHRAPSMSHSPTMPMWCPDFARSPIQMASLGSLPYKGSRRPSL
jgi:hypothetical protein